MQMTKRIKNGIEILALKGDFDLSNAKVVKTILDKEIVAGQINLVMDLSELDYIDSSGIGVFINTMTTLRGKNGKLVLLGMNPNIHRIFEMTKLLTFFVIVDKEEDLAKIFPEKFQGQ